MTVNERIREIRLSLGKTQVDFAASIFISNGYIADLENGHRQANDRILHLIALTYGVSEAWLKTGEGAMFQRTPEEKVERIIGIFNELSPAFQDCALNQLDCLVALQKAQEGEVLHN